MEERPVMGVEQTRGDEQRLGGKVRAPDTPESADYLWMKYAYHVVVIAVLVVAGLYLISYLASMWLLREASDKLHAPIGVVTTAIAALVGAFFGHTLGAVGKERAERRAEAARQESENARREKERVKSKVLATLPSDEAEKLLKELEEVR